MKNCKNDTSPFDMDWGEVTPDIYSKNKSQTTNISSHSLLNQNGRKLSPIFSAARIIWYSNHLPGDLSQKALLDIRGQREIKFNQEVHDEWRNEMNSRIQKKGSIKYEINLLF